MMTKNQCSAKKQIEIEPGLTVLVGCNGSGKTTLLDQLQTIIRDKEIPYIKYNNLTDDTSHSMSMTAYFGNFEQMSATFSSSEGENIALSLGKVAEKIGQKIKECEEDHKTQLFIFMDGIDSGLSIDAIEDVKKYLFDTIFRRAKDLDVYLIVSANDYTLTINDRVVHMCIQEIIRHLHLMKRITISFCNPGNEKISDLHNIFSKNSHICNEGIFKKGEIHENKSKKFASIWKYESGRKRSNGSTTYESADSAVQRNPKNLFPSSTKNAKR